MSETSKESENGDKSRCNWLFQLIIALIGAGALIMIGVFQSQNARRISEYQSESTNNIVQAQIASSQQIATAQMENEKAMQQIKIMEVFLDKMSSKDVEVRKVAIRYLSALDDSEFAEKLLVIALGDPSLEVQKVAREDREKRLWVYITAYPQSLSPGGETDITIRVEDRDGSPISDAQVVVSASGGSFSQKTGRTNVNGVFTTRWHSARMDRYVLQAGASKEGHISDTADIQVDVHEFFYRD